MELRIAEFSAADLPRVQNFECGSEDWAVFAAEWIKDAPPFSGALQSMQRYKNKVWLYSVEALGEEYLVGFSSLGTTKWAIPPPDGPKRKVGLVPMIAVASNFQGKPEGNDDKRYAHQIMEDVIEKSRQRGFRELCLFVHEKNVRAIKLYERYGFQVIGDPDGKGLLHMLALLD